MRFDKYKYKINDANKITRKNKIFLAIKKQENRLSKCSKFFKYENNFYEFQDSWPPNPYREYFTIIINTDKIEKIKEKFKIKKIKENSEKDIMTSRLKEELTKKELVEIITHLKSKIEDYKETLKNYEESNLRLSEETIKLNNLNSLLLDTIKELEKNLENEKNKFTRFQIMEI